MRLPTTIQQTVDNLQHRTGRFERLIPRVLRVFIAAIGILSLTPTKRLQRAGQSIIPIHRRSMVDYWFIHIAGDLIDDRIAGRELCQWTISLKIIAANLQTTTEKIRCCDRSLDLIANRLVHPAASAG
jgi:hypothetical protein